MRETDQMKAELRQVSQWLWDVAHDEDDPRAGHLAALTQTVISAYLIRMQDMELHMEAFHAHPEDAPEGPCGHPDLTPADKQEEVLCAILKTHCVLNCNGDRVFLARQFLAAGFVCNRLKGE